MSPAPERILVVHSTEVNSRKTVLNHLRCYREHLPETEVVYHHYRMPHRGLRDLRFDLIVLNYCFLSKRNTAEYRDILETYAFLAEMNCPVVALPQDDFSCSAHLDEWLYRWRIHTIFTPRGNGLELLFPHASRSARIERVLPGYVDEQVAARLEDTLPAYEERTIDLGTRVRFHPYQHGWFGRLKGADSIRLGDAARRAGFRVDVSTDNRDVLLGSKWYDFLGSCRFTVARRGGSSLIDPYGEIKARILAYTRDRPDAPFEEVEAACFPGEDLEEPLSAMTPRVLDGALTRTCLILPEDDYEGLLRPYEHYLPLPEDDDYDDLFEAMRDDALVQRLIDATYEELIASGKFSYAHLVQQVTSPANSKPEAPVRSEADSEYWQRRRALEQLPRGSSAELMVAFQRVVDRRARRSRIEDLRRALQSSGSAVSSQARTDLSRPELEIVHQIRRHRLESAALALLDDLDSGQLLPWSLRPWYFETFDSA